MIYTLEEIKNKTSPIFENYGIEKAYIFGSYAKNMATDSSDVDIVIAKGRLKTLFELSGLQMDLIEMLDKNVDLITEESLNNLNFNGNDFNLKDEIYKERIMFYG